MKYEIINLEKQRAAGLTPRTKKLGSTLKMQPFMSILEFHKNWGGYYMKHEYKKHEKELYCPKDTPHLLIDY